MQAPPQLPGHAVAVNAAGPVGPGTAPMGSDVHWLPTGAISRLFSVHRFGWYRFLVALLALALITDDSTEQWRLVPAVVVAVALLWWLPGGRQRTGVSNEGVVVWGLIRRRSWAWSEVLAIHLGMIPAPQGGAFPGLELLLANGQRFRLIVSETRGLEDIVQLLDSARAAGVRVVGSESVHRRYAALDVDSWGIVEVQQGAVLVTPAPVKSARELRRGVSVALAVLVVGMGALAAFALIDWSERRRFDGAPLVRATVVSFEPRSTSRLPQSSTATVRFELDGSVVESTVRTTRLSVGPTMLVHVDPDDPSRLRAYHSPEQRWVWPIILSGTAVGLGGWLLWHARAEERFRRGTAGPPADGLGR